MKKQIILSIMMLGLVFSTAYSDSKGLEVSFGVVNTSFLDENKTKYNLYDNEPLGFDCEFENEIILKLGDLIYKYDENEKNCKSNSANGISILTWYATINNLYQGNLTVDITEVDIANDDYYTGNLLTLSSADIRNIKNGNYVKKNIGNNYFVGFKGILLDNNIAIRDFSEEGITTFEAFYKESSSGGWIVAGVLAIVAVVTIVVTGGTASPIVASIGTAIGEIMGLSGVAATNAGLALLGGGSIVSGGFGIIGGTVLLTGALTFGTEVIVDYAITKTIDEYNYSEFSENSKNMMTLPLPKNSNGCDSYENAMSILEDVDSEAPLSNTLTQSIIQKAIEALKVDDGKIDLDEKAKKESLSALLYFISNNYTEAKKHAELSISLANEGKVKHTLPAYIVATSSLYDETFNYEEIADKYLKYSFVNEADNPILPLLLSIHLDRMMYRFGDGMINEKSLNKVFKIVSNIALKELKLQNYIIVLSRYTIRLKLEQQKISSLAVTENKTIKNSPKTLLSIKNFFKSYDKLINGANNIIEALEQIEVEDETEIEAKKQVNIFKELIVQYANDKARLQGLIQELETYQASLSVDEIVQVEEIKVITDTKDNNTYLYYIGFGLVFMALIGFLMTRRREWFRF